jgi:hypothetical protein
VPLKFPGGEIRTIRFTPLCSNTSNLTLCETPLVFRDAEIGTTNARKSRRTHVA